MKWYEKLGRKVRWLNIPNLIIYVSALMLFVYAIDLVGLFKDTIYGGLSGLLYFDRAKILSGEVWRVLTFVIVPSSSGTLSLSFLLGLYVNVFIGRDLEAKWGTRDFTLYYVLGIIGAIIGGFVVGSATNGYLAMSLLLAYTYLFPDTTFLLFFLIPVKAKYLGIANWILIGLSAVICIITLDFGALISLAMCLVNYFLFFGQDIISDTKNKFKYRKRRKEFKEQMKDKRNDNWY